MCLLILGGTQFLGRAIARHAHVIGHDVTCAARGVSGAVPSGAHFIRVDRDEPDGLAPLAGESQEFNNRSIGTADLPSSEDNSNQFLVVQHPITSDLFCRKRHAFRWGLI